MKKDHKILLIVSLALLAVIFTYIAKLNFNPSSTIIFGREYHTQLTKNNYPIPSNLIIYKNRQYDGQFFYITATDILRKSDVVNSFRYQRILYPLLVYLLSLGTISIYPVIFILINLMSIVLSTYILILILKKYQANLNYAYLWAFNIGFIVSLTRNLCEPLLYLWIILCLYFLDKKRFLLSSLFLIPAILTKESALLIIVPLIYYFLYKKKLIRSLYFVLPLLIYILWQYILAVKFGRAGLEISYTNLSVPFFGIIKYISQINFNQGFIPLIFYLSNMLIILFALIQLYVIFRSPDKKITLYLWLLIFQILLIFSFHTEMYTVHTIDAISRHAIALYLLSILYAVERKQKYNRILASFMIIMPAIYLSLLIFYFYPRYFIT